MEWAYRLSQEPRRLAKRYLHDFGYFGYFFAHQWWAMRQGTAVSMAPLENPKITTLAVPITPPAPVAPAMPPAPPVAPAEPMIAAEPEIPVAPAAVEAPIAHDSTPVLPLQGRLDINNQEAFAIQASYMIDQSPYLIINMAGATFLDSSALGALVALANQARAAGGALWLVAMPPQIKNLIRLVRLDSFFEVYPNAEEAEFQRRQAPQPIAPQVANNGWSVVHLPRIFDGNNIEAIFTRCLTGLDLNSHMVIDFSETSFMSSAGMVALLKLDRTARAKNGALRIVGCSHDVLRTLKLIRLDGILTVMADVATATKDPIAPAADLAGLQAMPAGQQ
jgi:N-acetylglucosaminyldiphosphoundecaprenol N-acetyl-beta-D-mannosaminyltransferase